jgi:hypothetical protein
MEASYIAEPLEKKGDVRYVPVADITRPPPETLESKYLFGRLSGFGKC